MEHSSDPAEFIRAEQDNVRRISVLPFPDAKVGHTRFDMCHEICRLIIQKCGWPLLVLPMILVLDGCRSKSKSDGDPFMDSMNVGKNYYDKGEAGKAVEMFTQAVSLNPSHIDAHLNLANARLLAGDAGNALKSVDEALKLDPKSPAAHYIAGCANLRLARYDQALAQLQTAKDANPGEPMAAVSFQLGLAHLQLKHWEEAVKEFQAAADLEPKHPSVHYNLSQALIRANRTEEAAKELELHQQISGGGGGPPSNPATFEKCAYTQARVPFKLEQPDKEGIKVAYSDQTARMFGGAASSYSGPVGVLDIDHRGKNDLFVLETGAGFRLLVQSNGTFQPISEALPAIPGAKYARILVGDLQNDRFEDVIALGDKGSHVFKFATNGAVSDVTAMSRLGGLSARDGVLVDLDFTGKLDLMAVTTSNDVRVFRSPGPSSLYFRDISATSGVPANLNIARELALDDWNNDDLIDVAIRREGSSPQFLSKQRGGPLLATNVADAWPTGPLVMGDLNNDLRPDVAVVGNGKVEIIFQGVAQRTTLPLPSGRFEHIQLFDFDNDGWLDICVFGDQVRVWRNAGALGFQDKTEALGLNKLITSPVESIVAADFDSDCDQDLVVCLARGGLQFLRNDGGNANKQLKVRLYGNRSNASGLGIRVEVNAAGLRTRRAVMNLPVEIGVGKRDKIDSVTARWFDLEMNWVDVVPDCKEVLVLTEMILPTGSCPYLYAWDGQRYRFVTDILGASPLGLPVAQNVLIDADPVEYVWIGNERMFRPRDGNYSIQITEELREVLYLDEARLVIADHPIGSEIHPTSKLVPGKPFPPATLMTLHNRHPLLRAQNDSGLDVTKQLGETDGLVVSPSKLRIPQLRGLAEPHAVTLDFGPLDPAKPLVLAMTGWLRFGGGMANMAASHDPGLPFPFPTLEAEVADGSWHPVQVTVGAPAGKTKTILVDLQGKLPPESKRLRIRAAFEIHWDRIALFEKDLAAGTKITSLQPARTDLHWRGFSAFEDLPWYVPLTPRYEQTVPKPPWRITPAGWCTRYGAVNELIEKRDDALVLLNGGDELTLEFPASQIPSQQAGMTRDFFLYADGWDKDADFHVKQGWRVEPLPFHGMNDQLYGQTAGPSRENPWAAKYNTRWVGPLTFNRKAK